MQNEAINISVKTLTQHAEKSGGRSRGKIILPCGTGKSRIALRIIERLTELGEISAILCPSIALVAQLRREFLNSTSKQLSALAVCSDDSVGRNTPRDLSQDPTADISQTSASEVKGLVTTNTLEIKKWMEGVTQRKKQIGVIFGTYQSSHRIADALLDSGIQVKVMVADEAHRTAGLRRIKSQEEKIRNFTVCHDDEQFPAKHRVYQTATPKVYDISGPASNKEWMVRSMDDEKIFGVNLYRKSYQDAVKNGWLSDYRIIAVGINDKEAYKTANALARESSTKKLSSVHFLKGLVLALVMSGETREKEGVSGTKPILSSINFMNEIAKSKEMVKALNSDDVQKWLRDKFHNDSAKAFANYRLEHLDATSNVAARESAKARLATATADHPHGIINVGIFGEGVDAPSLSAVGFLEPRRSPVDVIQAVGRVMRRSPGKDMGYIICPIMIPPDQDAESWLKISGPEDGWRELGEILVALRAHDSRIEDELAHLMQVYLPPKPETDVLTMVALGIRKRIEYHGHRGKSGSVLTDIENVLTNSMDCDSVFCPLNNIIPDEIGEELQSVSSEPHLIATGKRNHDGSIVIRQAPIVRDIPKKDGELGRINIRKSKKKARDMLNDKTGEEVDDNSNGRNRSPRQNTGRSPGQNTGTPSNNNDDLFEKLKESGLQEITVNLLSKSGLSKNRIERDVNIIRESIEQASYDLKQDELGIILDKHFDLDNLDPEKRKEQADGCKIASLLLMNAAMLHQRIAIGGWLNDVKTLDEVKNSPNVVLELSYQWNRITRHDFLPVMEPALGILETVQRSGREEGLNRALRHLSSEAERVAESYADLGSDHAGPLFNQVMGNQASDGAYFTRPIAASIMARLVIDALGDIGSWKDNKTWKGLRTVDPACGSGTILSAILAEMKRRASIEGASKEMLAELQKLAVEQVIAGLDINEVSLQLAAAQLTAGNSDVAYRKMGLFRMPYGIDDKTTAKVGSLELLGQKNIVPVQQQDLFIQDINSEQLQMGKDNPMLEDAVNSVQGVRMVVMNPPFTNRTKMGEKFEKSIQKSMRIRTDELEELLVQNDSEMDGFADKNSIGPLFVALADRCLDPNEGLLAMVNPTIALTAPSGHKERIVLAKRFHIHSLISCHQPNNVNLSQNTAINETLIIAKRCRDPKPPTRIINLDRLPKNDQEVEELHTFLKNTLNGLLPDGWGEVSEWPSEQIEKGDWTAAVLRSPKLAEVAMLLANHKLLLTLEEQGLTVMTTKEPLYQGFVKTESNTRNSFPVVASKSADGQCYIEAHPDEVWKPNNRESTEQNSLTKAKKILEKAGHLLITNGQGTGTARLTAVASDKKFVGTGWTPVSDISPHQAKAVAVFLNSTLGRCQFMRSPGMTLAFPNYNPVMIKHLKVPDITNKEVMKLLAKIWEETRDMNVPQYREGECEVRKLWDEAVAEAMGWDSKKIAEWRNLLHMEPHVRGLTYNEFGEEME